jgi:hypothetical protein
VAINSKSSRRAPTSKETGGGGTAFEFEVFAWLLAHMLAGVNPTAPSGRVTQVRAQLSDEGKVIDDLSFTVDVDGREFECLLFVRSQILLTAAGLNGEFVAKAQRQIAVANAQGLVGCVGKEANAGSRAWLNEVLEQAVAVASPIRFESLISTASKAKQRIADSLALRRADGSLVSDSKWKLAKCLWYHDFGAGQLEKEARELCERVLDDPVEWKNLWNSLLARVMKADPLAEAITYPELVDYLRARHRLKVAPAFDQSWRALNTWSRQKAGGIVKVIGGNVVVERDTLLSRIFSALESSRVALLQGPMGSGKTVATCQLLERQSRMDGVIRLSLADNFPDPADLPTMARLAHAVPELLWSSTAPAPLIVFDQADEAYFDPAKAQALRSWMALLSSPQAAQWRVVIACSTELVDKLRSVISLEGSVPIETSGFDEDELARIPNAAQNLDSGSAVSEFFRRPLFLDLALSVLPSGDALPTTEADLAVKFWAARVRGPLGGQLAAKQLAQFASVTADRGTQSLPEGDSAAPTDNTLLANRILITREDGRIGFAHDVFGRWARFQRLVSLGPNWTKFIAEQEREDSFQWQSAIELLALYELSQDRGEQLLDVILSDAPSLDGSPGQDSPIMKAIRKAACAQPGGLGRLNASDMRRLEGDRTARPINIAILNGLIESPLLSYLINRAWERFAANHGWLLRLLLRQVALKGTLPNPLYFSLESNPEFGLLSRTFFRIPRPSIFAAVLPPLFERLSELKILALPELMPLVDGWILRGTSELPCQASVEEFALAQAEECLTHKHRSYDRYDEAEGLFRNAIGLFKRYPAQVRQILLKGAGRIPRNSQNAEPEVSATLQSQRPDYVPIAPPRRRAESVESWQKGPLAPVDEQFARAWFSGQGIDGLCSLDPDLAIEITLSCLIEFPRTRASDRSWADSMLRESGFNWKHAWSTPGWWHSPLPQLFRVHPLKAMDLCLKIIEHGTHAWLETHGGEAGAPFFEIFVGGRWKRYWGSPEVLRWNWNPTGVALPTASAAIFLEKLLYDLADANLDRAAQWALAFLETSDSACILGIASEFCRRHPKVLGGELGGLLSSHQLIGLENLNESLPPSWYAGPSPAQAESTALIKWFQQPHKRQGLFRHLSHLVLAEPPLPDWIKQARARLEENIASTSGDVWTDRYHAMLDPANYPVFEVAGQQYRAFREPDHVRNKHAEAGEILRQQQITMDCNAQAWLWFRTGRSPGSTPEELWSSRTFLEQAESDPETFSDRHTAAAVASLLVDRWPDWVAESPERLEWCLKRFELAIEAGLCRKPDGLSLQHLLDWHLPATKGLPRILLIAPEDRRVRASIATVMWDAVLDMAGTTVEALIKAQGAVTKDAKALAIIAIIAAVHDGPLWCRIGAKGRAEHGFQQPTPASEKERERTVADFSKAVHKLSSPFSRHIIESLAGGDWTRKNPDRTRHRLPPADFGKWILILGALDEILTKGSESDQIWLENEWRAWMDTFVEFVVANIRDDDDRDLGEPVWAILFLHLARFAMKRFDPEGAVAFVGPLFELGVRAAGYVRYLISAWRVVAFGADAGVDRSSYWTAAVRLAQSSPQWFYSRRQSQSVADIWGELLDLPGMGTPSLPESASLAVYEIRDVYRTTDWLWKERYGRLNVLTELLMSAAGSRVSIEALQWFAEAASSGELNDTRNADSILASYLQWIWQNKSAELEASTSRAAFDALLNWLVGRKNSLADEIKYLVLKSRT